MAWGSFHENCQMGMVVIYAVQKYLNSTVDLLLLENDYGHNLYGVSELFHEEINNGL